MRSHWRLMMSMMLLPTRSNRLRRLGKAGFAFFAAKGLLWLLVPLLGRLLLG